MADGTKHDAGKPRMDLIPPRAEMLLAEVLTFGANRYGDDNWRDVPNMERCYTRGFDAEGITGGPVPFPSCRLVPAGTRAAAPTLPMASWPVPPFFGLALLAPGTLVPAAAVAGTVGAFVGSTTGNGGNGGGPSP